MNVWTFSGRVGADAEQRTTQSGEVVVSFRVANDIGFGDRRTTQWVDCSYWGKRAAAVQQYIRKGDKITVSGELKLEEFQRRDGTPGSKLAVRVNDLDLATRQESGGESRSGSQNHTPNNGYGSGYGSDGYGGGGGNNRGGSGGGGNRGGGKPQFDQDLDDEIPF